jgi:cell division protein FtsZ
MAEVNRVMDQVKRQCSHAQIIMGAAVDAELKSKLCVTVIAARPAVQPAATSPRQDHRGGPVALSGQRDAAGGRGGRQRRPGSKLVQSQLPLSIISKGRFDKSEPTLHHGEDLDVPTFLRRGIALN